MTDASASNYLHGYSEKEQARLRHQARFLEHKIYASLPFHRAKNLIEIGSGVGAQTEILLRRFPELYVAGVERNLAQIAAARAYLGETPWAQGRFEIIEADAMALDIAPETFDAAFLCWILEHVPDPARVLGEARRVLRRGAPIVANEVQNASFFLEPYSPNTLRYWMAFNDHQWEMGGDPFVGAKLGNLLLSVGFRDIETEVKTFHLDNRAPGERAEFLAFWSDLLLSGAPSLIEAQKIDQEVVDAMTEELKKVSRDPNSVFFFSFVQARARAW